jgi:N-acetylneuraminic acid mutarotase
MSPAPQSLIKRLVVFTSLVVLGSSIAFLLAACGGAHSSSLSLRERTGSSSQGWQALPAAPIAVDAYMTSVWTGKEMIVSGVGGVSPDGTFLKASNVAAAYDPTAHTWRRLAPPLGDRTDPTGHSAVWTGTEMLVWGAFKTVGFDPLTNHWRLLPPAPGGAGLVVWTGSEMIGWGGGCCGDANSGGAAAYSPATNTWRKLARSPLAPGQRPIGAWTGRQLVLLVGGIDPGSGKPWPARLARAAAYDPATDTWRRIAPLPESGLRFGGTAVWDGREVLVVGAGERSQDALAYNPATNRWRRLASMEPGHGGASAVWTGKRLLVWGGSRYDPEGDVLARHGLTYDPNTDRWSALPQWPLRPRDGSTVVWTGRQLVVWGGVIGTPQGTSTPPKYLTDGAAFTPALERSSR